METPEQAALTGFSPASGARVVASHVAGDYAAVYVVTSEPSGRGDIVSIVQRVGSSWTEVNSGSAGVTWIALPDDDDADEEQGVLAVPGDLAEPGPVLMEFDGALIRFDPAEPYYVAVFVDVDPDAWNRLRITAPTARTE